LSAWSLPGASMAVPGPGGSAYGIDQLFEDAAIMDVCRSEPEGERDVSASVMRWRLHLDRPRSVGLRTIRTPLPGQRCCSRKNGSSPWHFPGPTVEQNVTELAPDTSGLLIAQPPPTGHVRSTTYLLEASPRNCRPSAGRICRSTPPGSRIMAGYFSVRAALERARPDERPQFIE
jgi:hypothetical protein